MTPDEEKITRLHEFIREKGLAEEWTRWVLKKYYIDSTYMQEWNNEEGE